MPVELLTDRRFPSEGEAREVEKQMHQRYKAYCVHGEWHQECIHTDALLALCHYKHGTPELLGPVIAFGQTRRTG